MVYTPNVIRKVWEGRRNSATTKILFTVLFILSLPYGLVVAVRNFLYDRGIIRQNKLSCPVISVGNITTGGTGKTPMVMTLATILKDEGFRPAILSRGYGGGKKEKINIVSNGQKILMGSREAGDEPFLMATKLKGIPVINGVCRFSTGCYAIEELGANVILLDDGFQHRALYRNVNIVLLDSTSPLGNGRILPCGKLREVPTALNRADIIVFTGNNFDKDEISSLLDYSPVESGHIFRAFHKPLYIIRGKGEDTHSLDFLKGKKVFAFAGIGNPSSFIKSLDMLHVDLVGFLPFPDHHAYNGDELEIIRTQATRLDADLILTTEKDGVRLLSFPDFLRDLFILHIEMNLIAGEKDFKKLILAKLDNKTLQTQKLI
jgi:tetraacyldisaccharide 4'-kinase